MHETVGPRPINAARLAALERNEQQPALLNEGQAAALCGVGRRKFQTLRQQPWFVAECTAVVLGPRALRWHHDELIAAMKAAPRATKLTEPRCLTLARGKRIAK